MGAVASPLLALVAIAPLLAAAFHVLRAYRVRDLPGIPMELRAGHASRGGADPVEPFAYNGRRPLLVTLEEGSSFPVGGRLPFRQDGPAPIRFLAGPRVAILRATPREAVFGAGAPVAWPVTAERSRCLPCFETSEPGAVGTLVRLDGSTWNIGGLIGGPAPAPKLPHTDELLYACGWVAVAIGLLALAY